MLEKFKGKTPLEVMAAVKRRAIAQVNKVDLTGQAATKASLTEFPFLRDESSIEAGLKLRALPMTVKGLCNFCGGKTFDLTSYNWRDDLRCKGCLSSNRKRQILGVLLEEYDLPFDSPASELKRSPKLKIHALENQRCWTSLTSCDVTMSEYLGEDRKPGQLVDGVRHEDVQAMSFGDNSLDVLISSDVLEHVPRPYGAHEEIFRCLRPGGRHVFTVPFLAHRALDEVRATIEGGKLVHHLPPEFHHDPLRAEGVLVFTLFACEMIVKLERMGYAVKMKRLHHPRLGILGSNGLVFVAKKPDLVN